MRVASIRYLNPLRLFSGSRPYERLPGTYDGPNGSASPLHPKKDRPFAPAGISHRYKFCKFSASRIVLCAILLVTFLGLLGGGHYRRKETPPEEDKSAEEHANTRYWEVFPRLNGYYNGVKTLVPLQEWMPEPLQADSWFAKSPGKQAVQQQQRQKAEEQEQYQKPPKKVKRDSDYTLPMRYIRYDPYPEYNSTEYLSKFNPVQQCYLDEKEEQLAPDVFVFPGVPQEMTMPFFGSHDELGLREDVCFERFGRFGPYGYGYNAHEGGLGLGMRSEQKGVEDIWQIQGKVNYQDIDWGLAQEKCFDKNKQRFPSREGGVGKQKRDQSSSKSSGKKKIPRQAFVLRTWTGFEYTAHEILALRSIINELSLKSGGEYDVHLLLHVKDDTVPIWTSKEVYQKTIEENVPPEFWGITTLWSVQLMRMYYPGPFGEPPANIAGQEIHGVYRSAHFALQWFAQEHPEYDYIWNWEMDMRYSGHNYEFHQQVAEWAKQQPRRGLWERNEKFWIPAHHGSWSNFTTSVDQETLDSGASPVWGPLTFPNSGMLDSPADNTPPHDYMSDKFQWGVGEEADLITFNPIFDPGKTNWVFRKDISGYDLNLPIPPRRCAIITVARLSRRLLDMMHEETWYGKHSAFPEMWPPTVALHHGFKAVYIPHPVFFDRKWPLDYMDQIFNYPENKINSPFGWGEHNWLGSSYYYNSGFSGALWRRWLGERENDEGGAGDEIEGSGRMCLRSTLHHPVKNENLPES
ncbi:MAG: hypothetical protein M1831_005309 [Alyxoria varia]|nr:MAG: hypothetical protein M1831_005309 [Alyxoria varia]